MSKTMTKKTAEAIVLRAAAKTLINDIDIGAGWICGDDGERSETDQAAIRRAIHGLAEQWQRRAKRLDPDAE